MLISVFNRLSYFIEKIVYLVKAEKSTFSKTHQTQNFVEKLLHVDNIKTTITNVKSAFAVYLLNKK